MTIIAVLSSSASLVDAWQQPLSRRQALQTTVTTGTAAAAAAGLVTGGGIFLPKDAVATTEEKDISLLTTSTTTTPTTSFQSYQVTADASEALSPQLTALDSPAAFWDQISQKEGALWLGEHHNSVADHQLQVQVLRELHQRRSSSSSLAIGLEQVQIQFQPVLDDFLAGRRSLDALRTGVEWDRRWMWPFDVYRDIFATARQLQIPLVALNVNSQDLALVERDGLPGLPRERLRAYIGDAAGFGAFARQSQFRTYVDYVIAPSYELHRSLGLLKNTMSGEPLPEEMSFRNFLSGRLLWDEAMAQAAHQWTRRHPGGLLVGLVGVDHGA